MPKKIIIFPFGGNARESLMSIFAINALKRQWETVGFIDDDIASKGKVCCGVKVLGGREVLKKITQAKVLAVPGSPKNFLKRKDIITSLGLESTRFATIIHPSVNIAKDAEIGYGSLIMPNVVISCGVKLGKFSVVLPNTVISHDATIGDYCCFGSNVTVSGNVNIGPECYIGSGVKIRENINIGEKTLLGLGSNVISDIENGVVAVGNPARILRRGI